MARRSIQERLAQLDAQRKTLQARLGKQDRANDTRRKVLLGALLLRRLESFNDHEFVNRLREWLRRELPEFLTRDGDKALFDDILVAAPSTPNLQPSDSASVENSTTEAFTIASSAEPNTTSTDADGASTGVQETSDTRSSSSTNCPSTARR